MATAQRETSGMRRACDRCHVRKLRCSRDPTGCDRCLKEPDVRCNYSPAFKVGRPSKNKSVSKGLETPPPTDHENNTEYYSNLLSFNSSPAHFQSSSENCSNLWSNLDEGFWNDFNFDADNLLGTENQPQSGGTIGKRVKLSNGSEQNTRRQDHGERSETTARTTQIPVQDSTGVIDFDFSLSSSLDGVEYNNSSASQDNGIEFNINKTVLGNDHDFCQNTATTGDNSSTDHIDPSPHPASPLSGRTQPAEETPSTPISTTCETIQRFATLQQQLCSQRASLLTITRSSSISNKINARSPPLPSQTQNIDIESIFSSCQEILDLTTSTFSYFSTKWKSSSSSSSSSLSYQTHHTTSSSSSSMNSPTEGTCMENDASSVLLVLGPLSLVVITYQDVLNICNAILQDMKEDFHSNTDRERSLSITPLQTPRPSHNTNSTSWRDLSTKLFATNATTLVSKIELETPLRLILLLNVMEFQLMRFERSLETFHSSQNNYNYSMKGGGSLRGIFVSSMSELRSVIKNLLGKVGETVREAKMGTGS